MADIVFPIIISVSIVVLAVPTFRLIVSPEKAAQRRQEMRDHLDATKERKAAAARERQQGKRSDHSEP